MRTGSVTKRFLKKESNNEKGTDNCIGGTDAPHSDDGTRKFEEGL